MNCTMVMLIMSCDGFSDLWDGHVKLLDRNWKDRGIKTVIVTDKPSDKKYDSVEVFAPFGVSEWSDRLKAAIDRYDAAYYFITLDDYFVVNRVDNERINEIFETIKRENIDYLRFFKHPLRSIGENLPGHDSLCFLKLDETYSVNLYSGIWKKEFISSCIDKPLNAWEFEVALTDIARDCNAVCAVDVQDDFEILDVVRKGKLIRKAAKYIKKNGLYTGDRATNSVWFELKLGIKVFCRRHLPGFIRPFARRTAIKLGMKSYSDRA